MKGGIITQARTTSSRLPGKVLMTILDKTLLEYHLIRLADTSLPVYLSTTVNTGDDPLVDIAEQYGIGNYRGSEKDVLGRFYHCASQFGLDFIVRVTGDCPLIDPNLINRGVQTYLDLGDKSAFVSNTRERTYPRGFDFSVFSFNQLERAFKEADSEYQREHVTPFIIEHKETTFYHIKRKTDASGYDVSVDTAADFDLIEKLITWYNCHKLDAESIIEILEANFQIA